MFFEKASTLRVLQHVIVAIASHLKIKFEMVTDMVQITCSLHPASIYKILVEAVQFLIRKIICGLPFQVVLQHPLMEFCYVFLGTHCYFLLDAGEGNSTIIEIASIQVAEIIKR